MDSLSVNARPEMSTSCAPSSDVTVPVTLADALDKLATSFAAVEPVTFNVLSVPLVIVTPVFPVVEAPDAEPEVATLTVSKPATLTVDAPPPDELAPFKLTVIASAVPAVTAAAKALHRPPNGERLLLLEVAVQPASARLQQLAVSVPLPPSL